MIFIKKRVLSFERGLEIIGYGFLGKRSCYFNGVFVVILRRAGFFIDRIVFASGKGKYNCRSNGKAC